MKELERLGKKMGFSKAILETGEFQHEAISLYEKSGYLRINNYGQYSNMPQSICMGKNI